MDWVLLLIIKMFSFFIKADVFLAIQLESSEYYVSSDIFARFPLRSVSGLFDASNSHESSLRPSTSLILSDHTIEQAGSPIRFNENLDIPEHSGIVFTDSEFLLLLHLVVHPSALTESFELHDSLTSSDPAINTTSDPVINIHHNLRIRSCRSLVECRTSDIQFEACVLGQCYTQNILIQNRSQCDAWVTLRFVNTHPHTAAFWMTVKRGDSDDGDILPKGKPHQMRLNSGQQLRINGGASRCVQLWYRATAPHLYQLAHLLSSIAPGLYQAALSVPIEATRYPPYVSDIISTDMVMSLFSPDGSTSPFSIPISASDLPTVSDVMSTSVPRWYSIAQERGVAARLLTGEFSHELELVNVGGWCVSSEYDGNGNNGLRVPIGGSVIVNEAQTLVKSVEIQMVCII